AKRPDLIFAHTNAEARAVLAATSTIPVIFGAVNDPVAYGMVKSLARPGTNATGVATLGAETGAKRMQLLRETMPKLSRVGVLMRKTPPLEAELKLIEQAAGTSVRVIAATVNAPSDLEGAVTLLGKSRAEAVLCTNMAISQSDYRRILGITTKY